MTDKPEYISFKRADLENILAILDRMMARISDIRLGDLTGQLKLKISGKADDIEVLIRFLCCKVCSNHVLSTPLKLNEREPGYHTYLTFDAAHLKALQRVESAP